MQLLRFFLFVTSLTILLAFVSLPSVLGQEPSKCKLKEKRLRAVQYRFGRSERSTLGVLGLDISVMPEQINADYLILLARHLNQLYCKEDRLVVGIFDRFETALRFNLSFQEDRDALRGEYVLNRTIGEEYVRFSTVPDYQKNYESSVKIDLTANTPRRSCPR